MEEEYKQITQLSNLVSDLEKENKELVDIRQKQMDKLNKMMDEEMEMELYLISEEKLPEDITAKQITNIDKILK